MNRKVFFDHVRTNIFGSFKQSQVDGLNAILDALKGWDLRWQAYALATAYGETAMTMKPIAEYGKGRGRKYGKPTKYDGQVAYGRGYVQLTWDFNYEKADRELGLEGELLRDFDLALNPVIAAKILRRGMEEGWFTGKALRHYFNDKKTDWKNARRIINGTDRAAKYAGWAKHFHRALIAAHKAAPDDTQTILPRTGEPQPVAIVCMGTNDWEHPRGVKANVASVINILRKAGIEPVVVLPVKTLRLLDARLEVQAAVKDKKVRFYDPDAAKDGIHMTTKEAARINEQFRPTYFVGDSNAVRVAMAAKKKYPHAKVGDGTEAIVKKVVNAFPPKEKQPRQEKPSDINWLASLIKMVVELLKAIFKKGK